MRRRRLALATSFVATTCLATMLTLPSTAEAAPSDAELAQRWAPVHYQDTADSNAAADYLSMVQYDGDWDTLNNQQSLATHQDRLSATVYYSVVETGTHWFITYGYYHPRDWKRFGGHENDMEGVMEVVRKDGTPYGTLEAMISQAHNHYYSYVPRGGTWTEGRESIDGELLTQPHEGNSHPTSFQEAKGHGAYRWDGEEFGGGDGIVYYPGPPGVPGEVPENGNDRSVQYQLVDFFAPGGLWDRRDDPETYAKFGSFRGDDGSDNAASPPWGWDDKDDGSDLQRGSITTDPARLIDAYFGNKGDFSLDYVRNPYAE
ncbi:hypothetical protein [Streptomyces sp. NPDC047108]|uniref:hypothetical protein n=1 Tax=Streptomyces sp. NPDC047108 TaxID=3155025 RepID=UPI0033E2769D